MGRARTLAQAYRHFGQVDAAGTSPLYEHVAVAIGGSEDALRAIATAPAHRRHPAVLLAALHDLAGAAIDTLSGTTDAVVASAVRRRVRADETGRGAVLYPAVAEAARRVGADAVGLIDVGCSAGFDLTVDRVGIAYSNGQALGDPSSPVQLSCSIVGDRPVPVRAMPEVVARIGVDREPIDVTDPDDARWLRACVEPDRPERAARLDAEIALAAADPPSLVHGDTLEVLPDALARVPTGALPVVTTTWALSQLRPEGRQRFLQRLREAAAIGRCWSRGRMLEWLADSSSLDRPVASTT